MQSSIFECHLPNAIIAASLSFQSVLWKLACTNASTGLTTSFSQHWANNIRQTPAALEGTQSSSSSNSSYNCNKKQLKIRNSAILPEPDHLKAWLGLFLTAFFRGKPGLVLIRLCTTKPRKLYADFCSKKNSIFWMEIKNTYSSYLSL